MGDKNITPALTGFPTTKPAIHMKAGLAGQFPCGEIYTGSTLIGVPLSWGVIESVGDFEPKIKFTKIHGHDWFRIDADKKHGRFNVSLIATDEEGRSIRLNADGVVELNEHTMPLLMGDPNAKTNPWGFGVEHLKFEGGHDVYKPLEGMLFACSQRFVKSDDGEVSVEIRASKIIAGSGLE
ncbi:uncharacterized protein GGS22DRAFT_186638 [Annulohypoxylon maeteangense]|uniref:uncharacterized protein n=1 Tax=Annulohypoxylon maeteangense TaxID=1927788 RepID=UPI00200815C7|nr:uncharacterized protein GGS22DRAFT_186638 [Annulohypoxylon maeteangense]KAI0886569.1 hypothetical protein GGS22DRAFT_186638 [Annulohypoxylon maeteangense]